MLKRVLYENIWSLTVPVSVVALALAALTAGSSPAPALAWLALCLAGAGLLVLIPSIFRRTAFRNPVRAHHLVINLAWCGIVTGLAFTGQLGNVLRVPGSEYYPGETDASLVQAVAAVLREKWRQADHDMYRVDTTVLLTDIHEDAEDVISIEPVSHDRAYIYVKRSDDLAWRFELTDVEELKGEWRKPVPWPGALNKGDWRSGEPIERAP